MTSRTPSSGIRKFLSIEPVQTRTPEQKTGPNVFYVGASEAVLNPLAAPVDETYIWAQPDPQRAENRGDFEVDPVTQARTTLNTAHPRPWGWRVWTYLWTKSIAAGAVLMAAILLLLDEAPNTLNGIVGPRARCAVRLDHRGAADLGPQAPGPVLLPVHQTELDVVARSRVRSFCSPSGPSSACGSSRTSSGLTDSSRRWRGSAYLQLS